MIELLVEVAAQLNQNEIVKYCMAKHDTYSEAGGCISQLQAAQRHIKEQELREFIKANPQYRYPGMALPNGKIRPLDECWGMTRMYHKEGGCLTDNNKDK